MDLQIDNQQPTLRRPSVQATNNKQPTLRRPSVQATNNQHFGDPLCKQLTTNTSATLCASN